MNFEQRANIKFCFKLGKTFTETHNLMKQVYGDNCVARASVYEWYTRFHDCVTISKQCLEMFQRNPNEFLGRFITIDETWIHYFTPETKEQSKQWTSPSEPAPKKAKTVKSERPQFFMTKFSEFRYELLPHPAYSSDLIPCYFLFPNLKKWFGGKRFITREQLIAETEAYFEGLNKSYYSDGLKKLENHWIECIELKGDCRKIKIDR
ncbi:SETMR methyltransferase, partial [Acromyrmex insinuator]